MSVISSLRAMPVAPHVWHVRGRYQSGGLKGRTASVCVYTAHRSQDRAWDAAQQAHGHWLVVGAVRYVGEGVA